MSRLRHVIIGHGPAGVAAARSIRKRNSEDEILVISEEPCLAYSRILLPDYIAGRVSLDKLWLYPQSYYDEARIQLRLRTKIISVLPGEHSITAENGEKIFFDRLMIACGGLPILPEIDGITDTPAVTLKTISDAQNIIARVRRGSSVLILARDLVGIEMTRAFCLMGLRVTYIEWGDELLPHIIDPATAEELADRMKAAGVQIVVGERIHKVEKADSAIVVHTTGKTLRGDTLAVAIGKTPRLDWLEPSGVMTNTGIIVDERLRTNHPNIFAAGDAAEIYDPAVKKRRLLFGWKNATEQGQLAGANMAGDTQEFVVTYAPGLKQIFGVDIRHRWK
ncbi:MAG: FAD-dependent oxidoreductase [Candidatus Lindowbacteria bacterium]|nr:FAD-dependent oxidoreductase [Candidatus Lindowbacteria bacterium]